MGRRRSSSSPGTDLPPAPATPVMATPAKRSRTKRSAKEQTVEVIAGSISPLLPVVPVVAAPLAENDPLVCLGPLVGGTLIRRPSATCRTPYVADIQLDPPAAGGEGKVVMAHAPGMDGAGMVYPGSRVFMTVNPPETVKTCTHTIQMVHDVRDNDGNHSVVGYHPTLAERIAKAAIARGLLTDDLGAHISLETQKTFGETRVDFLLGHADGSQTLVEVKNVTGADFQEGCVPTHRQKVRGKPPPAGRVYTSATPMDGTAWAPTAIFPHGTPKTGIKVVSDRAIKHLHELTELQRKAECESGIPTRCAVMFVVNRGDCASFRPCDESDPLFANVLKNAQNHGVRLLAHDVVLDTATGSVNWGKRLPMVFRGDVTGEVDAEHLDKVLHFNRTDPRKRWKTLKNQEQGGDAAGPSTPKAKATSKVKAVTSKAQASVPKASRKKKRKETTSEEDVTSSVTEMDTESQ